MRIIHVPYSNKVQSIIDTLISSVAACGFTFMGLAIFNLDCKLFLIGGLIAIPLSVFLWKMMTLQILFWTNDFITIKVINEINDQGFQLSENKKKTIFHWADIQSVSLEDEKCILIKFINKKELRIDNTYYPWYLLLQKIPSSKLESLQISHFLEKTFSNLKTCKVCGSIALKNETCLSCGSETFNQSHKEEFENEIAYNRSEQLELFSTIGKNENVDFYEDENDGFRRDITWKPIVTEKEVLKYSEPYW